MNKDIRVDCDFATHPKTIQLVVALGETAPYALIRLWAWCGKHRTDGNLAGLPDVHLEQAINWKGQPGLLMRTLRACHFIDGDENTSTIHDWFFHNPWAADAPERREKAMLGGLAKKHGLRKARKLLEKRLSAPSSAKQGPSSDLFSAPSPSPSPSPSPIDGDATGEKTPVAMVWDSYSKAYLERYKVEPTRNAKVNGQLAQFCKRVPETEAPAIAAHYVRNQTPYYVARAHDIGTMLRDAEKLRTEYLTKRNGHAGPSDASSISAMAWEQVVPAIKRGKGEPAWKDQVIGQAIKRMGGWSMLRDVLDKDLPHRRREFMQAYDQLAVH